MKVVPGAFLGFKEKDRRFWEEDFDMEVKSDAGWAEGVARGPLSSGETPADQREDKVEDKVLTFGNQTYVVVIVSWILRYYYLEADIARI